MLKKLPLAGLLPLAFTAPIVGRQLMTPWKLGKVRDSSKKKITHAKRRARRKAQRKARRTNRR